MRLEFFKSVRISNQFGFHMGLEFFKPVRIPHAFGIFQISSDSTCVWNFSNQFGFHISLNFSKSIRISNQFEFSTSVWISNQLEFHMRLDFKPVRISHAFGIFQISLNFPHQFAKHSINVFVKIINVEIVFIDRKSRRLFDARHWRLGSPRTIFPSCNCQ